MSAFHWQLYIIWFAKKKIRVTHNTDNFNFNFKFQSWLNWLSYHLPAPPKHVEHDRYHTTRPQNGMHNKSWFDCCIQNYHKHIAGTSEVHRRNITQITPVPFFSVVPMVPNIVKESITEWHIIALCSRSIVDQQVRFLACAKHFGQNMARTKKDCIQSILLNSVGVRIGL